MSKQTAVDWLKEQLEEYGSSSHLSLDWSTFDELVEKAKVMEREQTVDAYKADRTPCSDEDAQQYFNETYGGEE